jgi:hypothetical protein
MSSVEEIIKLLTKEQKITELKNYFAAQGISVDVNDILANRLSDSDLDIALLRIAGMSATDNVLLRKITNVVNCVFGASLSAEQLAEVQRIIHNANLRH